MTEVSEREADAEGQRTEDGTSDRGDRDDLADLPDGCGCAEVWEHLSERRAEAE